MPVALEPLCIQIPQFDLARTLDCGQAFRWSRLENGAFHGVAFGWPLTIWQEGEQVFFSCSRKCSIKSGFLILISSGITAPYASVSVQML